jgi:hypothetical protein
MRKLKVGAIYTHYKGAKVRVLTEALHSETKEELVVYIHLDDGQVWVRPIKMFLENVVVNGKQLPRFTEHE